MDKNEFRELNMADRNRIRGKVVEALKDSGYDEASMKQDESFVLATEEGELRIPIEVLVHVHQKPALLVKCVRGHLSTRERASLALARLLAETPVPFAIVANEKDAAVFDTITGKAVCQGYGAFPGPREAEERLRDSSDVLIPPAQRERERRILHTYFYMRCTVELEPF